jgi:hypothetical protein
MIGHRCQVMGITRTSTRLQQLGTCSHPRSIILVQYPLFLEVEQYSVDVFIGVDGNSVSGEGQHVRIKSRARELVLGYYDAPRNLFVMRFSENGLKGLKSVKILFVHISPPKGVIKRTCELDRTFISLRLHTKRKNNLTGS